ncbi:hypothetical protein [Flavobacterium orientale]|uniref:Uncharacterized protein n=1 Tax=Flavobacterium orientale TaxID=1756020 RepID=A0A917DBX3_9FLAO|nr:hypothetical protein [Flavobacterium orientale]MDP2159082.1 hypothetical protein [Flavobacterium sp.]GGD24918.1 hypothetical protein GCM10011343_13850 [Flavobacterium orientale]
MNRIFFYLILLFANITFAQKNYKIGNISWTYEIPKNYFYQTDNFSQITTTGEKFLENDTNLNLDPEEDILFAIAKEKDSNFNIIMSSYLSGNNIKKFGINEYINKLIELFEEKYKELETPINISKEEIEIDGKVFYKIKNIISDPQKKYTTFLLIGEISNKELQILYVIDNEVDEKLITESILKSKFK